MQEHAGKAEQRTQRDATRLEECRQALWQMKHDVAGEREGELEWGKARSGGCCKKGRCLCRRQVLMPLMAYFRFATLFFATPT